MFIDGEFSSLDSDIFLIRKLSDYNWLVVIISHVNEFKDRFIRRLLLRKVIVVVFKNSCIN